MNNDSDKGTVEPKPLDCILCDNSGIIVMRDDDGRIDEIGPCEWCFRTPNSKFNLLRNKSKEIPK